MSNHLDSGRMLELLDRLKTVVHDSAGRAEQLEREFTRNTARLDRQIDQEIQEQDAKHSTAVDEIGRLFEEQRAQLESAFERRKAGITAAHAAARKHHLKLIESREGRQINEVQRELLQTSRTEETSRKEADNAFTNCLEELARERDTLARLERKTLNAFRGFGAFRRLLATDPTPAASDAPGGAQQLLEDLRAVLTQAERDLRRFRVSPLPLFFSLLPPWMLGVVLVVVHAGAVPLLAHFDIHTVTWQDAAVSLVASLAGACVLHFLGRLTGRRGAKSLAASIGRARALADLCESTAQSHYDREQERIRGDAETRTLMLNQRWTRIVEEAQEARKALAQRLEQRRSRASTRNDHRRQDGLERLRRERDEQIGRSRAESEAARARLEEMRSTKRKQFESDQQGHWQALEATWKTTTQSIYDTFTAARESADRVFPEWSAPLWEKWAAPREFAAAAPFGRLEVDVVRLSGGQARHPRLPLPGPERFAVPLCLTFPGRGSILFETKDRGRGAVVGALNNLVLRLLSVAPPGRVVFTILDPLDLGQSFAGLMHLTDHEDRLINRRIWTQPEHIEQRLAELNEHIEKVTQLYLRNEYTTIAEYNEQAGRIAEPCHFLVVADFPVNFTDLAVRRLISIAASGPRCGVFSLIHWDRRKPAPMEFVPDDLRQGSVRVCSAGDGFMLGEKPLDGATLVLESPPDPDRVTAFLEKVGRISVDSNRVEMPFADIAPDDTALWTLDTAAELRVPIGRTGATKFQQLALGKGTRQHMLIAGKTGSGKSTLFHVIITNLALWCSPEQAEFYLVDFKKGVEFKCYASFRLPHAKVVAVESDREFGLSVLERVDEELRRRGDLFRGLGVQDLAGYKRVQGTRPLPRTLLIIDEFQEFFVEDDAVSQTAALLLDRLVRQGRAFGIHVLLGSQTLGGAYTLARSTLGQMVVRIALQCNEADAMLIMDDDNPAPRLLSRPGEAIYNDAAGAIEGNSPFQVVWLPEVERESWLKKVRRLADQSPAGYSSPVVFEGNALATVGENTVLHDVLNARTIQPTAAARAWIGAPNSIKGPTEVVFHRQTGSHLLIVGQRDESAVTMIGLALVAIAAQHSRGSARFIVLDVSPAGSRQRVFLEKVVRSIPHDIQLAGNTELPDVFARLAGELDRRANSECAEDLHAIYLFIHGLQQFKALRYDEDFGFSLEDTRTSGSPGAQFNRIICEGNPARFHVACTCDTVNNVNRILGRKTVSEFGQRVLFQMSASDSASLIDTGKAAHLGLHRALLQNVQAGTLETFRPYGIPDDAWLEQAAAHLSRLGGR